LLTDVPPEEFKSQIAADPRGAKVELAKRIVRWLHSSEAADAAAAEWDRVKHDKGAVPENIPEVVIEQGEHRLAALLVKAGLTASNGEATRKIKEGAVYLDGEKFADFQAVLSITAPRVIKLGKRFVRLLPQA
jgi:tyrosyl-tRNA synthetase